MSIAEFHPEELFDKWLEGELSAGERARLHAHLEACPVCRFEYAARLDFQGQAQRLGAKPIPSWPLPSTRTAAAAPRRRRRSRVLDWGLAAAALIVASGALAAALEHAPWRLFAYAPLSESTSPARATAKARSSAAPPAIAVPAPSAAAGLVPSPHPVRSKWAAPSPLTPRKASTPAASAQTSPASASAASTPSPTLPSAAELFEDANQARRVGDTERASTLYRALTELHPGSVEAELSRVTLATLLLDRGDPANALLGFERYLGGRSRALEVEALVGRARALQRLGRKGEEISAWQAVKERFPGSVYARQAAERLTALGKQP